jgi:predicted flap endonuclease-1-like 5' DNA nuclease
MEKFMNTVIRAGNKASHLAEQYAQSIRAYLSETVQSGQKEFETVSGRMSGLVGELRTQGTYISEPTLQFFQQTLKQPIERIRHPLSTVKGVASVCESTLDRAFRVASQNYNTLRRNWTKTDVATREQAAYAGAINSAIDQAVNKPAGRTTSASGEHDDLHRLPQVGPALVRKLHAAGIYSYRQIAEPNAEEKRKLAQFSRMKSYAEWVEEARRLNK